MDFKIARSNMVENQIRANKVNDKDSVALWDIIQKGREEGFWDLSENTDALYQLCLL